MVEFTSNSPYADVLMHFIGLIHVKFNTYTTYFAYTLSYMPDLFQ